MTERLDDMTAIARSGAGVDENGLIDRILAKGTTLTRTDVKAVFTAANEAVAEGAECGETFTLPLMNISFSIAGVFEEPLDVFDGNRHKLNIILTKGVCIPNL